MDLDGREDEYYTVNVIRDAKAGTIINSQTNHEVKKSVSIFNDNKSGTLGTGQLIQFNITSVSDEESPSHVTYFIYIPSRRDKIVNAIKSPFGNSLQIMVFGSGKSLSDGNGSTPDYSKPINPLKLSELNDEWDLVTAGTDAERSMRPEHRIDAEKVPDLTKKLTDGFLEIKNKEKKGDDKGNEGNSNLSSKTGLKKDGVTNCSRCNNNFDNNTGELTQKPATDSANLEK